jgi:hypothetical protein
MVAYARRLAGRTVDRPYPGDGLVAVTFWCSVIDVANRPAATPGGLILVRLLGGKSHAGGTESWRHTCHPFDAYAPARGDICIIDHERELNGRFRNGQESPVLCRLPPRHSH